jgi:hypothetical protein
MNIMKAINHKDVKEILLVAFVLGPPACFPTELIWNYGSHRQLVGTRWTEDQPVATPLLLLLLLLLLCI